MSRFNFAGRRDLRLPPEVAAAVRQTVKPQTRKRRVKQTRREVRELIRHNVMLGW